MIDRSTQHAKGPPRIAIVTASHLCRNPRVLKEATALGDAGYDVTVLTVSSSGRFEQIDRELIGKLPFRRIAIDLTPSAPFIRRQSNRIATWLARKIQEHLRYELLPALGPANALRKAALNTPADLTIAHTELPLCLGSDFVRNGRKIAVDFEDWYSEDLLEEDRASRPLRLLRSAEAFALRNAVFCSAPSESMAARLSETYSAPIPLVVRNVPPLPAAFRIASASVSELPSFVWFSQTVGPGRGLEQFIAAWCDTKSASHLYLIGDKHAEYQDTLSKRTPENRRARIHFLPFIPPTKLPDALAGFDIGLALEPHHPPNKDLTISNKIFQYLNAGLAVVASNTTGQREVLNAVPESGISVDIGNTKEFSRQLDFLLSDRARLRAMQTAARRAAEQIFCWEKEFPRLLTAVKIALAQPTPA